MLLENTKFFNHYESYKCLLKHDFYTYFYSMEFHYATLDFLYAQFFSHV